MFDNISGKHIGVAMCGSFCTFSKVFGSIEELLELGAEIHPIMSFSASSLDTRFGAAAEHIKRLEKLTGRSVLRTIEATEPLGPKKTLELLLVANCTGNTLAKLAASITDTPVTMAVKSHLRSGRPVLLNVTTNDALSGSAKNIGSLMNLKSYYFVPIRQDDFYEKPTSAAGDFSLVPAAVSAALAGKQLQPVLGRE